MRVPDSKMEGNQKAWYPRSQVKRENPREGVIE